jgi:hypothetical protein
MNPITLIKVINGNSSGSYSSSKNKQAITMRRDERGEKKEKKK